MSVTMRRPSALLSVPKCANFNFIPENGRVYYGEGIFIGYRYYDKKETAPLLPFD